MTRKKPERKPWNLQVQSEGKWTPLEWPEPLLTQAAAQKAATEACKKNDGVPVRWLKIGGTVKLEDKPVPVFS